VQSISCETISSAQPQRAAGAIALLTVFVTTLALAADARVPYVPTPQEVVERMLETARVGPRDYLIDLGSGDGRIVVTAAKKYGARGFGVDLNPDRIRESNENARAAGVTDKVAFHQRNLFETDLSTATVITMYLLPRVNLELRPKLLELAPGTRLVSHDFDMGDWKPDTHFTVDAKEKYGGSGGKSDVYFWVVPARAAGLWQWETPIAGKPQSYEVRLEQKFQTITGSARIGEREVKLQSARLRGAEIHFAFTATVNGAPVKHEFTGKMEGDSITGSVSLSGARIQAQLDWSARRPARAAQSLSPGVLN
jgi:hypothetical protein